MGNLCNILSFIFRSDRMKIQDGGGGGGGVGGMGVAGSRSLPAPYQFFPLILPNMRITSQNPLTLSLNSFVTVHNISRT